MNITLIINQFNYHYLCTTHIETLHFRIVHYTFLPVRILSSLSNFLIYRTLWCILRSCKMFPHLWKMMVIIRFLTASTLFVWIFIHLLLFFFRINIWWIEFPVLCPGSSMVDDFLSSIPLCFHSIMMSINQSLCHFDHLGLHYLVFACQRLRSWSLIWIIPVPLWEVLTQGG